MGGSLFLRLDLPNLSDAYTKQKKPGSSVTVYAEPPIRSFRGK